MKIKRKEKIVVLGHTKSVCPECLSPIPASYVAVGENVYMKKTCPEHGRFAARVWRGVGSFEKWRGGAAAQENADGGAPNCPHDCGSCENHGQEVCCVLLELTSRCNLSCPVCFASAGDGRTPRGDPGIGEIGQWYDMLMARGGPFNIQLSGGEPSLRDDLPEIIKLGREKGFGFFQLNTNGIRIADEPGFIQKLADAGLSTVFLQFDGLNRDVNIRLRGLDLAEKKLKAVENCARAGVGVVLVPTVVGGVNDSCLGEILEFAARNMPVVRGVHFQPVSLFGRCENIGARPRVTIPELLSRLEAQSGGKLLASDFVPSGAEHPLCSFHADYTVKNGSWKLVGAGGGSCCCKVTSAQARQVVARKWSRPGPEKPGDRGLEGFDLSALDDFLREKNENAMAISGMAFQDAWNLDLERLRRCYVHEVSRDGRLIPFCAYNLTARDGRTIYR